MGTSVIHNDTETFAVEIGSHPASFAQHTLVVTVVGVDAAGSVNLSNVLFGEQYLCSGQSVSADSLARLSRLCETENTNDSSSSSRHAMKQTQVALHRNVTSVQM